ncbi:Predicted DNA-binding protein, MmcQ/YjbR family [Loktanella atrilutea]|uniref:Predicted DNA-binding protein, MmcQ/YjbR family n=2 Tax=Loktanella atrilutea TaxID=366533 RepID=A0A1M4TJF0_LOKAT|nr:Predicted DNA-binding protein, MmcQ/YjbR family [Loktanella atrilutea]
MVMACSLAPPPAPVERAAATPLTRTADTRHDAAMSRQTVSRLCAALPGATLDHNFGPDHDSWKIGGKLFAIVGSQAHGVSVNTDSVETARMLIDAGVATRAPYCHASWVSVPMEAAAEEMAHRIAVSYRLVRASLTRKAQAALPPAPDTAG